MSVIYRVGQKVRPDTQRTTSSNTGRFSQVIHYHILQKSQNKAIIKSPGLAEFTGKSTDNDYKQYRQEAKLLLGDRATRKHAKDC